MTARVYGVAEVAAAIGKTPGLVAQWHRRRKLPPPDDHLASGPVWHAATIEPWIAEQRDKQEAQ